MPAVGELLELLYTAHRGVRSMSMAIHDWSQREASNVLIVQPGGDAGLRARWLDGGPNAMPLVTDRRIWFEPPSRIRVEIRQGTTSLRTAVRNGNSWWRWDRQDGETAGELVADAALPPVLDTLQLNPARLLSSMWLDLLGREERISRPVLVARGRPREPSVSEERYVDLVIDSEHGTPLYVATYEAGERTSTAEVQAIDYDEINPAAFRFELDGGKQGLPQTHGSGIGGSAQSTRASSRARTARSSVLSEHRTVWLTGLPAAGKTTIARTTERLLHQLGIQCCVLDGDEIRHGLSSDLGLSRQDRAEQARRLAHVATVLADSGVVPIVAFVSPDMEDRERAREIHESKGVGFLEVWVDTPPEICSVRDRKGPYADASRRGSCEVPASVDPGLTGISSPYEAPPSPDLVVSGDHASPRVAAREIVEKLIASGGATRVVEVR